MTAPEDQAAVWKDAGFARLWAETDGFGSVLAFPWKLAAALVADDRPGARLVVDVASGPGAFLATFLKELPGCAGVWMDASEAMLEQARERLARFGGRVEFQLGDMTDLDAAGPPGDADALITSRALHHLDHAGLVTFYAQAARHLAPGGWLVNLDHTGPADVWDKRFRAVRERFTAPGSERATHPHHYPFTSIGDHLDAFAAAGIDDVEIAWKALYTCLFMARKPA